ncbi:hypothetical protein R2083_02765 [Nitrosomonas sp. Is35]|uniref:hypothetical protein n=1 Tax=Nitrosomonas sp. Is35 TaxID=3080534 RepID=UPI00294B280D|nr:hypothetical protein [Nitrosomonas sp. Is35]MDV6346435.1 hypothetical protein [Nitrosomonas sp. Is35]
MTGNFIGNKRKNIPNLLTTFALILISLGFQSFSVKAEIISYPAKLVGCMLGGTPFASIKSTCPITIATYYNATSVSCSQEIIYAQQNVTCTVSGLNLGIPWTFTATQAMWPWYVCSYGGMPVAGVAAYNCEQNTANINLGPVNAI